MRKSIRRGLPFLDNPVKNLLTGGSPFPFNPNHGDGMLHSRPPESKLVVLWDGRAWSSETADSRRDLLNEKLSLFIHLCGGDMQRCLEGPYRSIESFIQRHRKIFDPSNIQGKNIVVIFTKTAVLTDILQVRQLLEIRLSVFSDALFVIYDDVKCSSRFYFEMEEHGALSDTIGNAPIWTSTFIGRPFLVLTPDVTNIDLLQKKMRGLKMSTSSMPAVRDPGSMRPPSNRASTASMRAVRASDVPGSSPKKPTSIHDLPTVRPPPPISGPPPERSYPPIPATSSGLRLKPR